MIWCGFVLGFVCFDVCCIVVLACLARMLVVSCSWSFLYFLSVCGFFVDLLTPLGGVSNF